MMKLLVFVFLVGAFAEIAIIVWLSLWIGFGYTFLIILFIGGVGLLLVKQRMKKIWRYAQEQLAVGVLPTASILDAICIALAGFLFILPGLLTDAIGILLLLPFTRKWFKYGLLVFLQKRIHSSTTFHRR